MTIEEAINLLNETFDYYLDEKRICYFLTANHGRIIVNKGSSTIKYEHPDGTLTLDKDQFDKLPLLICFVKDHFNYLEHINNMYSQLLSYIYKKKEFLANKGYMYYRSYYMHIQYANKDKVYNFFINPITGKVTEVEQ